MEVKYISAGRARRAGRVRGDLGVARGRGADHRPLVGPLES